MRKFVFRLLVPLWSWVTYCLRESFYPWEQGAALVVPYQVPSAFVSPVFFTSLKRVASGAVVVLGDSVASGVFLPLLKDGSVTVEGAYLVLY